MLNRVTDKLGRLIEAHGLRIQDGGTERSRLISLQPRRYVHQQSERRRVALRKTILAESADLLEASFAVDYMHREAEETLPELLSTLGVERPILIGHSDGASIALIYAGSHIDAVRGLVALAPHVFVEDISVRNIEEAKVAFETTDMQKKLARYHTDARRTFYGWNDIWLHPDFRRWNIEAYLPRIRCPVLAVQGVDDEYGTMAQIETIAARVAGPCELVKIEACGHRLHRDQHDATLEVIARFVAQIAP